MKLCRFLRNQGFERAWSNLKDRYENKRILVNSQLKVLFNMLTVKSEKADGIKRLQRDINNCISAFHLHEIDISNWDPILVYLCSTKLPELTLSLWEQTVSNKTEIPKWKDLDTFLTSRFQSMETVSDIRSEQSKFMGKSDFGNKSHTGDNYLPGNNSHSGNNSFLRRKVRTYEAKVVRKSCPACSMDHLLRTCPKFLKLTPGEIFQVVKRNNLCINCLSDGHKLNSCQSNFSCSVCKMKHHSLLYREVSRSSRVDNYGGLSTSNADAQSTNVQSCFATASKTHNFRNCYS